MKKGIKTALICASLLFISGVSVLSATACAAGWDFKNFDANDFEKNVHEVGQAFSNISIETDTADVVLAPSADGKCKVDCYEEKKAKHSVSVQSDTLEIRLDNQKVWYDYIELFNFNAPRITVYLPQTEYAALTVNGATGDVEIAEAFAFDSILVEMSTGDVKNYASAKNLMKIKTSTGDICVENVSANALDLTVSTGSVTLSNASVAGDLSLSVSTGKSRLTNVRCKNFNSEGGTGKIILKNVIASGKFFVERDTGDVELEGIDAAEISIKTSTGDVEGWVLSEKVFIPKSSTGDIDVPKTVNGGRCEITTSTGDIEISIGEDAED